MSVAPLGRRAAGVTGFRRVGAYDVLAIADPGGPVPDAGQFYMLAAAERWGGGADERPFLPRAFSVLRASGEDTLEFMLEDVGPGTHRLGELRAGDGLWLAGPFGNGFAPPRDGRRPLLVGGGVGTAPLAALQDVLASGGRTSPPGETSQRREPAGRTDVLSPGGRTSPPGETSQRREPAGRVVALLGFRDAAHAEGASLLADARVATDDGSVGHAGPVTDLLLAELGTDPHVEVYACGPPGMLEAVREICVERGVPAQLALESGMACGYGACFGCVVPTKAGYVRLCVDGPVLEAAAL
jgi:dihydroorotate dehydrogenase electron transfer subunit